MSKRCCFLMCFVLVLGLSGAAQATAIDDCRYNLSFELMIDPNDANGCGNLVCGHTSEMTDVLAWEMSSSFAGVDVNAPHNTCGDDRDWGIIPDGNSFAYMQSGKYIYQVLNPAFDGNAAIQVGRKYTLTFDATVNSDSPYDLYYSLFYGDNPEANEITIDMVTLVGIPHPSGRTDWTYDLTLGFVSQASQDYLGKPLGIKFDDRKPSTWLFVDDVRLDWVWATSAYGPIPADGAEDVARDVNLAWTAGGWADDTNGQHVYFGTSLADVESRDGSVYFGVQSPNSFDPTPGANQLDLGQTYYWAIDEVNDTWSGIAGIPDPPWVGDVWSFEVTGYATNPDPEDEAEDVSLYTGLSWTPGTDVNDVNGHDVYFGTDEAAVDDANQLSSEYMGRQDANDFNDFSPALELGKTYYWRIDEVNVAAGTLIKGKLWSFTIANYLRVDDMDSYADDAAIKVVWKDKWSGIITKNNAEVFLEFADANKFLDTDRQSMKFYYRNFEMSGGNPVGCTAEADTADLEIGTGWVSGGVEALMLNFCGDTANGQEPHGSYTIANDRMWMSLLDGDGNEGIMRYPDMNHVTDGEWHEWNIELADPNLADVNLADVVKVYIGFGGVKGGAVSQYGAGYTLYGDTVWFDDIRLYPPRCRVEIAYSAGSFDYDDDCAINYQDLYALTGEYWLISGIGMVTATAPNDVNLVGHWTLDDNKSTGPPGGDKIIVSDSDGDFNGVLSDADNDPGTSTGDHHTEDRVEGTGALTFDGYDDYIEVPTLDLNSNTVTISAWIKRDGAQSMYAGIVHCQYSDPCDSNAPGTSAGIDFGSGGTYGFMQYEPWEINHELCYFWYIDANDLPFDNYAWDFHTGLIVPNKAWSFVALVVEPNKATVYLDDGTLQAATNRTTHYKELFNGPTRFGDQVQYPDRFFKGAMDDVRIYDYSLTPGEILYLSQGASSSQYVTLPPGRPDADGDNKIDLKDYAVVANNWLKEILWPAP